MLDYIVVTMVFITLPPNLTEEEEMLQQKFAKLKKKRKALAALKTPKLEKQESVSESVKRPAEAAADATEQAKKLIKLGAIKVEPDRREQQTFKRTKRQKDMEKQSVGFQPFSQSGAGEDTELRAEGSRSKQKYSLYDNFVAASDSPKSGGSGDRLDRWTSPPQRGNTVYVHGHGVSEEIIRRAFAKIGGILNISMDTNRNCGFVMFENMDLADRAISETNGCIVSGVQLKVSVARRQPTLESITASANTAATDNSSASWSSIAASSSQKGSHQETREMVTYDEDDIF